MNIRSPRDFWAGALYLVLAAVTLAIGKGYTFGASSRMGPGYFPMVLGGLLALIGIASVLRAFLRDGEPIERLSWRPVVYVLGSVLLFGFLLERLGVVAALAALILVSALASSYSRFDAKTVAAMAALIAVCVLVFVKGLGVPMPLLGSWLGK